MRFHIDRRDAQQFAVRSFHGKMRRRPSGLGFRRSGRFDRVQEFMAYERRLAAGATLEQIIDNRCGQWLFIYVVLQSLPMTAVDARDLSFTEGAVLPMCFYVSM